jgi:lysophospholipase L1-like esterase
VISSTEAAARKLTYKAGQNSILLTDETLTDLTPYMQGPYAALQPYARARQTKSTDILPLSAGSAIGVTIAPNQILGVSVPLADQYVLIPTEIAAIETARQSYNAVIQATVAANSRLALADVNAAFNSFITTKVAIANNITVTPNINPPTGIYSEDGLHPNSRGYAFIANIFIDGINAKFGSTIPKVNLAKYSATALPIP